MTIAMAREAWTDERLDGLKEGMHHEFALVRGEMDRRFDEVDRRFDKVEARFDKVDRRFEAMDARFDALNARFDAMQRTLIASAFAVAAAIIAAGIF